MQVLFAKQSFRIYFVFSVCYQGNNPIKYIFV